MHKIKIILLSLAGVVALFVVIMAFILSSYNNQDYQQLLIKTVDNLSDYTLSISGPFELQHSFTPVLSASKIELLSKTDNSYIRIDNFRIQITLAPLLNNTLLINDLLLENMQVDIQASEEPFNVATLLHYFPVPIIEHAVLKNVQLIPDNGNPLHTLDSLVITAKDRLAPLELHGTGRARGHIFEIDGQLGPLTDVFAQQPYPVNLIANWQQVKLSINGTITDPEHGEGLNLVGKINIPEVADVFATPIKGHLQGRAHLKGTLTEPVLIELQAALVDEQFIDLQMTGSIGNLLTQKQTKLHLTGFIHDVELLKWIMPDDSPSFNRFNIKADISKGSNDYILQNLNAKLSSEKGLNIILTGNTHVFQEEQPLSSLELQVNISSKNTETVNPYLGNILPEMGPVKASAQITMQGKDIVLSNINLVAGVNKKIQLTAKGRVGHLSMAPGSDAIDIALELALKAKQSSELTSLLKIKHPEIGPISFTASLNGSTHKLKLGDVKLIAGNLDVFSLHADGWIAWDKLDTDSPLQSSDFTIQAHSPSIQDALRLYGEFSPDLGPAKSSIRVHGNGMVLTGSNFSIQIGTKNSLLFTLQGKIAQMFIADSFHKGIELTGSLTGKSTKYLSKLLENSKIPDIGPLSGEFVIKGDSNSLQIPLITLSAGRKKQLMFNASGKITEVPLRQQVPPQGVDIALTVTAPNSTDLSSIVGSKIPDLGRLLIKGRLTDHNGIFAIKDLILSTGDPKQPIVSMSGSVEDVLSSNDLKMEILFDEKTLVKLFDLRPIPEFGQLKGSALLSNAGGTFSIKDFKIESGNSELIDLKVIGAIDNVTKAGQISANVDISIKQPELFGRLFVIDLSGFGPIYASGLVSGNKNKVTFKGHSFIGKTKIISDLALSSGKENIKISGEINSPNLFLEDLGINSAISAKETSSQTQPAKPDKVVLFSDTPLALQALHKVDLDLKFKIFKVTAIDYKLDRVNFDLLLQNGKLTANPVNFNFSKGHILLNAEINSRQNSEWLLNIQGNDIRLGEYFKQQNKTPPVEGNFNFIVDLKSTGISAHEIASNLKGELGFTLENGGINGGQLELIFLNPLGWLFDQVITAKEIHISCGLARYQVNQGMIRSKVFLIDGPKLLIRGKTEINLANETINSLYNLEKKNIFDNAFVPTFATTSVPIKISGNLSHPTFEQAPLPSGISKADRYIFAPVAVIPQELLGTIFDIFDANKDEQSPCKKYMKN